MEVVFSDLDGTLLDSDSYGYQEALPALALLRRTQMPLVLVTSKTRAEIEFWRRRLSIPHPFVAENGGAAFFSEDYFPFEVPDAVGREPHLALEFGVPYARLTATLDALSRETGVPVRGFSQMKAAEVARLSGLPARQAVLAKRREYDEPFLAEDPGRAGPLLSAIEATGLRWHRGGRYFHITGSNDKGLAVRRLIELFRRKHGEITTIGLGDAPNDADFLREMDRPVIVRSAHVGEMQRALPDAMTTTLPGPAGWCEAILTLLAERVPAHAGL